ncbi:MAG: hypothetical protein JO224_13305 [Pelomonas sp.]|nr:hypothetical protein [Roseateles sp.]
MAQTAAITTRNAAPAQFELGGVDAAAAPQASHAALGHQLGRDFARHGLTPPIEHLHAGSPLLLGWQTGRAASGTRRDAPHGPRGHVRQWLMLRTHAWARGRSFEELRVTPRFLQSIAVEACPITRTALHEDGGAHARSVDRVRDDAGYAAGNLVVMSRAANQAKGSRDFVQLQAAAQGLAGGPITSMGGLGAAAWQRLAVLASFVTELPHAEAAALPLAVLPPNRVQLFNPIQALQALLTREVLRPGWSQRLAELDALLPAGSRADFNRFLLALAPRALEIAKLDTPQAQRWALEDAWCQPLLLKRWTRFALQLDQAQAEALVQQAASAGLSGVQWQRHDEALAREGWALERRGYCAALAWH